MLVKNNYDFVFIAEKNNDDTRTIKKMFEERKKPETLHKTKNEKTLV